MDTLQRGVRIGLAVLLTVTVGPLPAVLAGPEGAQVVSGNVAIESQGATTTVTASHNSIINYHRFDIAPHETVQFIQPGASARVLNRILGGQPSHLDGTLRANGIVYWVNPAGVMFGPTSIVDVGGLYAAAAHISNADFLAGRDLFTGAGGAVMNYGDITGRDVTLVGRQVGNFGSVTVTDGLLVMASGEDVYIGEQFGRVGVKIEGAAAPAAEGVGVENAGSADAGRGRMVLAAGDLFSLAIRSDGLLKARGVTVDGGQGRVELAGTVDASDAAPGAPGGTVEVLGDRVVLEGATVDASGEAGGGAIRVGGDVMGGGDLPTAARVLVDADSTLRADALGAGDGGSIVVWGDELTLFLGDLSARGGAAGGDGGFAEVSGGTLRMLGGADLAAPAGAGGHLLLDPDTITIVSGATPADGDIDGSGGFGDDIAALTDLDNAIGDFADADSIITNAGVNALLTGAITLTLAAEETITVNGAVTGADTASLRLEAPTVALNQAIALGGTLSGTPATVTVGASGRIQNGLDVAAAGATVTVADGAYAETLSVNTANLTLRSATGRDNATLTPGAGVGINLMAGADGFTLGGAADRGFTVTSGVGTTFLVQLENAPQNVTLSHNTFTTTGAATQGISVGAAGAAGLTVSNNTFNAGDVGDGSIWGPSLSGLTVSTNLMNGPGGLPAGGYAIQFSGVTGASAIDTNTVTGYANGILVSNGPGTSGLTIEDNIISNCVNGLRFAQYSPGASGDMTTVTIENNTLTTNTIGLLIGDGANVKPDQFTVRYNTFDGNTTAGLQHAHTTLDVTAEKNWWGHATGPDAAGNPHGAAAQGDAVTTPGGRTVDFQPWYATGSTTAASEDFSATTGGGATVVAWSDTAQGALDAVPPGGDPVSLPAGTYTGTNFHTAATFTGNVTLDGVTLGAALDTGAGAFDIDFDTSLTLSGDSSVTTAGGTLTIDGAVTGTFDLYLDCGAGLIDINAALGSVGTPLAHVQTDGAGNTELGADIHASAGTLVFNTPVVLVADTAHTDTGGGITFNSTIEDGAGGPWDLTLTTTGAGDDITFNDTVGNANPIDVLQTNTNGGDTVLNTATIKGATLDFNSAVLIDAATATLTGTTGVDFGGTVDSQATETNTLAVVSPTTAFHGRVGNTDALATLQTDAVGTTTINTDVVTGATLDFNDDVVVGVDTTLTGTTTVDFAENVDSEAAEANDLTVNTPTVVFGDGVGTAAGGELGTLTLNLGDAGAAGNALNTAEQFEGATLVVKTRNDAGAGVTMNNAANDFDTLTLLARNQADNDDAAGALVYRDADEVAVASVRTDSTLNLQTGGAITDTGALDVAGATTLAAGAGNHIELNTATNDFGGAVTITSGNNVTLVDAGALELAASTVSGDLDVDTGGDLTLSGTVDVTGNEANFNVTGAVVDNNGAGNDVVATDLVLRATTGIASGTTLETAVSNLAAINTTSGNIQIANNVGGLLTIGTLDGVTGVTNADPTPSGGTIVITNASPLTVSSAVTDSAGGDITLTATNDGGDDDHLTINAQVAASGGNGNINLNAGTNLILNDTGQANDVVAAGNGAVIGTAGGDVTMAAGVRIDTSAGSGNVSLTADNAGNTAVLTMADTAAVDAGSGKVSLIGDGNVTLGRAVTTHTANDAITVQSVAAGILDGGDTGTYDLDAPGGGLVLDAVTGIGAANALETQAKRFDVDNSGAGNVRISNNQPAAADTTIASLTTLGADIDFDHTGVAGAHLVIDGDVTSGAPDPGGTDGGNIDIACTAGLNLTLNAGDTVSTAKGAGGALAVSGSTINGTLVVGAGTLTLTGGSPDTVIGGDQSMAATMTWSALRDVILDAVLQTTGAGNDINLTADTDADGVGGVWLRESVGDAQVDSVQHVALAGSDVFNAGAPASTDSVRIDADGANVQVRADSNVTLQSGGAAPAGADLYVLGPVQSDGAGTLLLDAADTVFLGHTLATVGGPITIPDPLVLTANVQVNPGAATAAFGGTVDGAWDLDVNGNASFGGLVGDTNPLDTVDVSGTTLFSAAGTVANPSVETAGTDTQAYHGAVTLAADTVLDGGDLVFNGTIDGDGAGPWDLRLASGAGGIDLNAQIGNAGPATALDTLQCFDGGTTIINTDVIKGAVLDFDRPVIVEVDTALTGTTSVDFNVAINSGNAETNDLVITSPTTAFRGRVGNTAGREFGLIQTDAVGTTTLDTDVVKGTTLTFLDSVVLADPTVTLTAATATFGGTVNSDGTARALDVNGNAVFGNSAGDFVGNTSPLAGVDVSGTTAFAAGDAGDATVETTGAQVYTGAVTLTEDATLLTGGAAGQDVTFGSTVQSPVAKNLVVNAGAAGDITCLADIGGGGNVLASVDFDGFDIALKDVTTTGSQSYTAAAGGTITSSSTYQSDGGPIAFAGNWVLTETSLIDTEAGGGNDAGAVDLSLADVSASALLVDLTIDTSTPDAFDGGDVALGDFDNTPGGQYIDDLDVDTTSGGGGTDGIITFHGTIVTTGNQTYAGSVLLGADAGFTSLAGNLAFLGLIDAVDNAVGGTSDFGLTLDTPAGNTTLGGIVGGGLVAGADPDGIEYLQTDTTGAGGQLNLDGGAVTTTLAQTYNEAVVLGANAVLTAGTDVSFLGTLNADLTGNNRTLLVNAAGVTRFGNEAADAVGGAGRLESLTTDAAGSTRIGTTAVTTDGASITFNDPLVVEDDLTVTEAGPGDVTFANIVDSEAGEANDLVVNTDGGGTTRFQGNVGTAAGGALGLLQTDADGATVLDAALVTGATLDFDDPVTVGVDTALTGTTSVDFALAVDSEAGEANDLVITSPDTIFHNRVGNAAGGAFGLLQTDAAGTTLFDTDIVKGADLDFDDAVTLGVDLTATGTTSADFGGTVDSEAGEANDLVVNSPTTGFRGNVGNAAGGALGLLQTDAPGTTTLDTALVKGDVLDFNDNVAVGSDTALTGTTSVDFAGTVDSEAVEANDLVITSPVTQFHGRVGNAAGGALGLLQTDAAGTTTLDTDVVTGSTLDFDDDVDLSSNTTLTGTLSVDFAKSVDGDGTGPYTLLVNSPLTGFQGLVGVAVPLNNVETDAAGVTSINGGRVVTVLDQTYRDGVVLGANTILDAGSDVLFLGTLDADLTANDRTLLVNAAGITRFGDGAADWVGGAGRLESITTDNDAAADYTILGTPVINTDGASITFNDPVLLDSGVVITEFGPGNVTFNQTVDSIAGVAYALTVNTPGGGDTIFQGAVGGDALGALSNNAGLGGFFTDGVGRTLINGGLVTTTGNQVHGDPDILGANTVVNGLNVWFNTINSDALLTPRSLVINAAIDSTFGAPVGYGVNGAYDNRLGDDRPLGPVTVNAGNDINLRQVSTVGDQLYNAGRFIEIFSDFHTGGGNFEFDTNRASPPTIATIFKRAGDVTITTEGGNVSMNKNDKMTIIGYLTIDAGVGGGNVTLGDVNVLEIFEVWAANIQALRRDLGEVLNIQEVAIAENRYPALARPDWIARKMDFHGAGTPTPTDATLAVTDVLGTQAAVGGYYPANLIEYEGALTAENLVGMNTNVVLDLMAEGLSLMNPSDALAGALASVDPPEPGEASPSDAGRRLLQELNLTPRDLSFDELLSVLEAGGQIDDYGANFGQDRVMVALPRFSRSSLGRLVQAYNAVFKTTRLDPVTGQPVLVDSTEAIRAGLQQAWSAYQGGGSAPPEGFVGFLMARSGEHGPALQTMHNLATLLRLIRTIGVTDREYAVASSALLGRLTDGWEGGPTPAQLQAAVEAGGPSLAEGAVATGP